MTSPKDRLKELGIELPKAPEPLGSYVPCVQAGSLLFLSGVLPLKDGKLARKGRVGEAVSVKEAQEDARQVVINVLSVINAYLGSLDEVKSCVKLNGYISSNPDFTDHPAVLNAASDLLRDIFGDKGRHARVAVGVSALPFDSPLEIDFIFEIKT